MTEKEWKIIGEEFISYTGGYAILIADGDCQFHLWETRKDAQKVCNKLNGLVEENQDLEVTTGEMEDYLERIEEENQHIKNLITEAYNTERTDLGRSVLKQLMEAIQ